MNPLLALLYNCNLLLFGKDTAFNYLGENTFPGHDTVAGLVIYRTPFMTDFPDLGDLEFHLIPDGYPRADGKVHQIDAFGGDVLGEITGYDVKPGGLHLADALQGQQADLPVPF